MAVACVHLSSHPAPRTAPAPCPLSSPPPHSLTPTRTSPRPKSSPASPPLHRRSKSAPSPRKLARLRLANSPYLQVSRRSPIVAPGTSHASPFVCRRQGRYPFFPLSDHLAYYPSNPQPVTTTWLTASAPKELVDMGTRKIHRPQTAVGSRPRTSPGRQRPRRPRPKTASAALALPESGTPSAPATASATADNSRKPAATESSASGGSSAAVLRLRYLGHTASSADGPPDRIVFLQQLHGGSNARVFYGELQPGECFEVG